MIRAAAFGLCAAMLAAALGARAEPPAPSTVTPDLVAAAVNEGKVAFYTSIDLEVAQSIGKAVEAKYPGIAVDVERKGLLEPFVPADVTRWPANQHDPDGCYAAERVMLTIVAYNTKLVSILIYDLNESGDLGPIAVLGLTLLAVTFAIVALANRLSSLGRRAALPTGAPL